MTNKEQLQTILSVHMTRNKITMTALAKQLGVSRQAIHKWLKTDCVSMDKLFELLVALGITFTLTVEE